MDITDNFVSTTSMKPTSSEPVFGTVNQSTPSLYLNQTTQVSYFNHTMSAVDFNQTTLAIYLDQNASMHDLPTGSIPMTGLTYTLFGLTCLFTTLGLCGNVLTLINLSKFRCRSEAHGVLLSSLAICDMVSCLSFALTQPCVHAIFGMDIRAITTVGCKISWAILFPATICSSAVVVLICIERYLAVWFPLRSRKLLSKENMVRTVWICVIPIVLIYVTLPVLYCEVKNGYCYPNFGGSAYSTVLNKMPNTSVYNAIFGFTQVTSILILSILTPMTIVKLYKQWVIRRQLTASELSATHFATSVKLVSVVVAYLILVGSSGLVSIIVFGLLGILIDENTISVLTLAMLLNHSINFLLYNVFDAEFRRNTLAILGVTINYNKARTADGAL